MTSKFMNFATLDPFTRTVFTGKLPLRDHVRTGPFVIKKYRMNAGTNLPV